MHIILIEIRNCHIGYLGCYGSDWVNTPAFDSVAATGYVFDDHYADCVGGQSHQPAWSIVNFNDQSGSLQSSLFDSDQVIHWVGNWPDRSQRPLEEVATVLRRLTVSTQPSLTAIALDELAFPRILSDTPEILEHTPQPAEEAETGLNGPETAVLKLREAYASRVEAVDQWLGTFLEQLREKKLLDRAAIIITADQGAPLGEHGDAGTLPPFPYEEIRHLPLIIHLPGNGRVASRVNCLTQASDLATAIPALLAGRRDIISDFDLLTLGRPGGRMRDHARTVQIGEAGSQSVALRTLEWAYLTRLGTDSAPGELYCKPDDRWEVNNVIQHFPDLVPRLDGLARAIDAR